MDIYSKEKRSELMKRVKNKDTNIELILRKKLYKKGYRYRLKSSLFGKPDIVFPHKKLVIFCDGDFWHGKTYEKDKTKYKPFWVEKIKNNIERDKKVNEVLATDNWNVLRFWKSEILKNPDACIYKIEKYLITS